ncbi:DNA polymerase III, subunit gamma and tau [Bartonella rochalimae ATCC BAA-1498]|uniref:DNA polymerase III subunit gamma/tau n=2 Tax=Bartonella rochalimae TaxID=395923 RepID=E6YK43_9HYPH|nr:DNA polymerase III subunit gamma/tau [Bartonella rochalimae]KEC57438.1 DNA polymerase III, subunit gamma and tau [Bartonella rochalimae ATCC BAA-1498]CBI77231.1 DNA polymerase III subunit tau [Bartonella rochalimae ATCC BAA-1498]
MEQLIENTPATMAYRVLARKYRPQNFSDLIGQEAIVCTLNNAFKTGRIAQAWMLTGIRGVGKTTTARILARALNYKTKDIDQPTTLFDTLGEHCAQIIEGRHIDVIEMDAASHTGIDDIREIIEQIRYRPVSARYKIYIIDEVHMLSTQAFNGLLKTLEEPPPHVKFIFATTEIRKVPITILSRCQRFNLQRIETTVLVTHLRKVAQLEKVEAQDQALFMIARAAEGSVRDALSIFDQAIAYGNGKVDATAVSLMLGLTDQSRIIDLFESLMKGNIVNALHELRNQYNRGADPFVILTELADFNHLITRLRLTPEIIENLSLTEEERSRSLNFSQKLSIRVLSRSWQMLLKGLQEVNQAPHPIQAAEMLLIRLAHIADLPTLDEALTKLTQEKKTPIIVENHSSQESINESNLIKTEVAHSYTSSPISDTLQNQSSCSPEYIKIKTSEKIDFCNKIETRENVQTNQLNKNIINSSQIDPQLDTKATKEKIIIDSLQDIVDLADQHNEIHFKLLIKEFVHPVSFEPQHITLRLAEEAPRSLERDIKKMLYQWTGKHWNITLVNEGGKPTLQEESVAIQKSLFADAQTDPDIAKILNTFPGAKIIDIRFNKKENDLDLIPNIFDTDNNTNDE